MVTQGRDVVCAGCGSTHVRSSRPHGAAQRLARLFGVRFHVCIDCGARGRHRGRHRAAPRSRHAPVPGRPPEARDLRAARQRTIREWASVIVAVLLGAAIALAVAAISSRL